MVFTTLPLFLFFHRKIVINASPPAKQINRLLDSRSCLHPSPMSYELPTLMPLDESTTTAVPTTMETESSRSYILSDSTRPKSPSDDEESIDILPSPSTNYEFDESQCLFCNKTNPNMDENLAHMSKTHGLHIASTDLLVDVESLLAYFHLVISEYYECLYCGTQRNTRQAAQQHMIAKGHCKYDITDKDSEFRDFYELSSSETEEEIHQKLSAMRFSDNPHLSSQSRPRRSHPSKRSHRHAPGITSSPDQAPTTSTRQPQPDAESTSNTADDPSLAPGELSTRSQKREYALNSHLAQLRASDRRNLIHLPASQQRALLATHHKQMEKARRAEQTSRSNLESAMNYFGRLGTTRLVRQPPHFGNVQGLNR